MTALQQFLSAKGYDVAESGTFDDTTESALWQYGDSTGNSYDSMLGIVLDAQRSGELSNTYQYSQEQYSMGSPPGFSMGSLAAGYSTMGSFQFDESGDEESSDNEDDDVAGAPAPTYEYQAQNRLPGYDHDNHPGTYYPRPEQASAYNVGVQDGRLTDAAGNPVKTTNVEKAALWEGSKPERMIYTMDGQGDLRMAAPQAEMQRLADPDRQAEIWPGRPGQRFHHSSLARGEDVSGAGEMKVREGTVEAVSDKSGHYRPDLAMTAQVDERLQAGGVDTSRVTYELGNYSKPPGEPDPDTLVSGTELGAYDREGILADIRSRFWQQAEEDARARFGALWDRLADFYKQDEIKRRYNQICGAQYSSFEAMDDRMLYAEARKIIEGRHDQLRTVLDDIRKAVPADWFPDPLNPSRLRWWDGSAWTAHVSDGRETTQDPAGAAALTEGPAPVATA